MTLGLHLLSFLIILKTLLIVLGIQVTSASELSQEIIMEKVQAASGTKDNTRARGAN